MQLMLKGHVVMNNIFSISFLPIGEINWDTQLNQNTVELSRWKYLHSSVAWNSNFIISQYGLVIHMQGNKIINIQHQLILETTSSIPNVHIPA